MKETLLYKKDMTWHKMLVFLCHKEVYNIVRPGISCHSQNKWWGIHYLRHQPTEEVLLRLERHHLRALSIGLHLHSVIRQTFWCHGLSYQFNKCLLSMWVKNYAKFLTHTEISISPVTKRFISKAKTDSCISNTKQTMKFTLHIYK